MRQRRGIALLAALWLIVAIAAVALQFSLDARERRLLGLGASDRGKERAAAAGGLVTMQARMEYDLRNGPALQGAAQGTRAADPWFGADSTYSGTIYIDSMPVEVVARDLGTTVNINTIQEAQLRVMLGFVFGDASTADRISAVIMDWRDADDQPRPSGAERDQYLQDNLMVLPSNGAFREVDDLVHVHGMTPELLEQMRPYFSTRAQATRINLNSAPEPVLRGLPGMTDAILNQILALRSEGRRITSAAQVMTAASRGFFEFTAAPGGGRGGPPNPQQARQEATLAQMTERTTVNTTDVELTFYVRNISRIQPTRLIAIITRNNTQATIPWQLW